MSYSTNLYPALHSIIHSHLYSTFLPIESSQQKVGIVYQITVSSEHRRGLVFMVDHRHDVNILIATNTTFSDYYTVVICCYYSSLSII